MPDSRLSTLRRPTLRESITGAVAAAGVVAVCASSAVSVADNSVPSRIALIADQQPAAAEQAQAAQPAAAPVAEVLPAAAPLVEQAEMRAATAFYPDNLHGWISQALDVMHANGIPGSYESIHRNIMRESTGNPRAINLYDSNAAAGIPSKGLLQVIDPTFAKFHVPGTPFDVWDPVANIVAACNYAAHTYGSMDNVHGAY
ncbi:transglycosylase SLT domain-containing protein [Nocardia asteroides]|uniref:transglycosylase SLT domain-containing protein n=1 Tax=Nocardia asteroides TaxID=1824 RepID=UPI001E637479|nr:transglycosylase SLT domain-containing protein [Nocardia asteroides]UGT60368.1 transglycosylase SLT domain-containing protein [Nocardia asteroides]